jgi:hypothetical protein
MLIMFLGLLRFSDAAAILVHADLLRFIYSASGKLEGVLIFICKSKMDQTWIGQWIAIGATGLPFCPASLLYQLLYIGKYVTTSIDFDCGPLLRPVRWIKKQKQHSLARVTAPFTSPIPSLSYPVFNSSIAALVSEAGLDEHITCHSHRIGGATTAFLDPSIAPALVRTLGRWKCGNTMDDTYVRPLAVAAEPFFELTRKLWKF